MEQDKGYSSRDPWSSLKGGEKALLWLPRQLTA